MKAPKLNANVQHLDRIQAAGGLNAWDIANVTDVSVATVSLWNFGTFKPQPEQELILSDLHYLVGRLAEYYSAVEIRGWLFARHPQLDGERAVDLIHERRTIEVLYLLQRLDQDAYV